MKLTHGAQTVETIAGKRIVKSGAVGETNIEEIQWLTKTLLSSASAWKSSGWIYMVDISKMSPVAPEVSAELVNLHKDLTAAGCKGMAFIEGASFFTAAQAKQHQKQSHTQIMEGHFKTEEDAIKWVDEILS